MVLSLKPGHLIPPSGNEVHPYFAKGEFEEKLSNYALARQGNGMVERSLHTILPVCQ